VLVVEAHEIAAFDGGHADRLVPDRRDPEDARMPRLAGLELQEEQDAAVGELRRRVALVDSELEGAVEIAVTVRRREAPLGLVPLALQHAPPDQLMALDVEEIGE